MPAAHSAHRGGAGDNHQKVGSEALDLLAHRVVRALADGDHGDQRGNPNEDTQHGQRRSHLVAGERLECRGHDHQGESLHSARAAGCSRRRWLRAGKRTGRQYSGRRSRLRTSGWLSFVRYHLSVPHRDDAVGIGRDVGFMRDDNDRNAPLAVERLKRHHDLMRRLGIEIAGGFIRKQQNRIVDQGARDGDALLLSAGQLPGCIALAIGQTKEFQAMPAPVRCARCRSKPPRGIEQGQRDILDRTGAGEKVEALKDKTQPFAADAREFRLRQPRDIDALQIILSAGRPIQAAEQRHQRGLPRSGRSHDGDEFAGLDGQIDAAQRMHVDVADVIGPRHVHDSDDWFRHVACEVCPMRRSETEAWRDGLIGRRELLRGDHQIARLHVAARDLREIIVVQPGHHRR